MNDKRNCQLVEKRILESTSVDVSSQKMLNNYRDLLKNTKFYDLGLQHKSMIQSLANLNLIRIKIYMFGIILAFVWCNFPLLRHNGNMNLNQFCISDFYLFLYKIILMYRK